MKFAYADPPYLDQCARYGHEHIQPYGCWDQVRAHALLIDTLKGKFPDGWALSASAPSLFHLLRYVPERARICAWVKPFAAFKANVRNAYTWEPVIVCGGRVSSRNGAPVTRDHLTTDEPEALRESITLRRGLVGVKPAAFNSWVLKLLGYVPGDELVDLFPGSRGMQIALGEVVREA